MGKIAKRINDQQLLKLIRAFLGAGVMEGGLVSPVDEGTPQGGPLSPLLSNIVLDELDRELERRGHRFVRYADAGAPSSGRRCLLALLPNGGLPTTRSTSIGYLLFSAKKSSHQILPSTKMPTAGSLRSRRRLPCDYRQRARNTTAEMAGPRVRLLECD